MPLQSLTDIQPVLPPGVYEHGILAAVSGGADSVALLHLLAHSLPPEGKLAVAHVNHGLRGADSDADAEFVQALAKEYGLRYFEHRLTPAATLSENSARNLRYGFLTRQAERIGFRYLATAHTADDQTETVLHRILRGTGLAGLTGMSPSRILTPAVTLLRPLLHVRRKTIHAYLESHAKTFRHDQTNFENRFIRNRIRNQLLPALREEFNPRIDGALCRLASLAAEQESILSELLDGLIESVVVEELPERVVLDVIPLSHCSFPVLREVLMRVWKRHNFPQREMDYDQWTVLAELFRTVGKRLDFPGGIMAERTQNHFVIRFSSKSNMR